MKMIAHPEDPWPLIGSFPDNGGLHAELRSLALSAAKAVENKEMSVEERKFLDLTVARLNTSMFDGPDGGYPSAGQVKAAWSAAYQSRSNEINNRAFRAALTCMYAEHANLDPDACRRFAKMVLGA